jgi:hypothetical protein
MPIPGPAELKFGTCHSYNLKFMPTSESISAVTFKLILPYVAARGQYGMPYCPRAATAASLRLRPAWRLRL